ncbi:MAG: hypothetical protein V4760_00085 [Bdellovibrionota bacterium]
MSFARHLSHFMIAIFIVVAAPFATLAADAVTHSTSKERSRLEELFIWKASEELKLPPADDTKFTEIIQSLNVSRRAAGDEMDAAVKGLGEAKTKIEAEKALVRHRAALKQVQSVQTAELDKLKPLLGPEKLARYLVVKNALLEKLKTMLSAPAPAGSPKPESEAAK